MDNEKIYAIMQASGMPRDIAKRILRLLEQQGFTLQKK
jgi:DNA-binding IclR family transcriptional regulator